MRIRFETLGLAVIAGLFAPPALAQDDEAPAPEASEPAAEDTAVDTNYQPFEIRRGFFVRGDVGVYLGFGGSDVDRTTGAITDNSITSLEPLIGITAGYDLLSTPKVNLSAGARFGYIFISGTTQVPVDQATAGLVDATTYPADYEVAQAGAAVDFTYMLTERFGLLVHADGGIGIISPDPDIAAVNGLPSNDEDNLAIFTEGGGEPVIGGVFSGGLGVEYNTKLTGFSIGATAAFYGVLSPDSFIPGIGIYVPLKYNF